jgi:hypothetical protein
MPKSSPPSKDAQAKGIIARGPVSGRKKYAASNTSRSTNPSQKLESATAKIPFPAPAPLNEQEKALVMLAQNHPQVVKSVAVDSTSDDPLAIPKLKIEPIEVSENREEER